MGDAKQVSYKLLNDKCLSHHADRRKCHYGSWMGVGLSRLQHLGRRIESADTMAVMMNFRLVISIAFAAGGFVFAGLSQAQTMEQQGVSPGRSDHRGHRPAGRFTPQGRAGSADNRRANQRLSPHRAGQTPYDQQQTGRLYFISYGVIAEYDQSQYIYLYDRKGRPAGIAQSIPPNTVFHLGLPKNGVMKSADLPLAPGQVNGRITGLLDSEPVPNERVSYDQLVRRQREVVVGALRRPSP
jgi:hypothetical protein